MCDVQHCRLRFSNLHSGWIQLVARGLERAPHLNTGHLWRCRAVGRCPFIRICHVSRISHISHFCWILICIFFIRKLLLECWMGHGSEWHQGPATRHHVAISVFCTTSFELFEEVAGPFNLGTSSLTVSNVGLEGVLPPVCHCILPVRLPCLTVCMFTVKTFMQRALFAVDGSIACQTTSKSTFRVQGVTWRYSAFAPAASRAIDRHVRSKGWDRHALLCFFSSATPVKAVPVKALVDGLLRLKAVRIPCQR
mmetsp:Transcript_21908/g.36334  ORF Transcript_21908/g.36334 Transcript_21908/m.36334 type:complete len:252 (-) Transcript_21908:1055-1810(-)